MFDQILNVDVVVRVIVDDLLFFSVGKWLKFSPIYFVLETLVAIVFPVLGKSLGFKLHTFVSVNVTKTEVVFTFVLDPATNSAFD